MSRFKIEHLEMDHWDITDTTTGKTPSLKEVCMLFNSVEDELDRIDDLDAGGVDNWEGYDYAMSLREED